MELNLDKMELLTEILSLLLWCFAAVFKAVMDTLAHHYNISIFWSADHKKRYFWSPGLSWKAKYRDDDKWYGWINNTVLVWTTDGWHMAQMLMKVCLTLSVVLYVPFITWYWDILIYTVCWGLLFELFYKYLLVNRKIRKIRK